MIGKITGTGSYIPKKTLHNNDLATMVETNDEWIRERTGIVKRHVIEDETTVSMAVEAAKRALENAGIKAEEIDFILVSTISSNVILPSTACEVQKEIGAVNATCFDLAAACTGFLFAYNTAQSYIATGIAKKVLIVGVESLSNIIDWTDRGTCILFGDGAGAAVVEAKEQAADARYSFPPMVMHSDGASGAALTCESRHQKKWTAEELGKVGFVGMNGQDVFRFAVKQVPKSIQELMEMADLTLEEIDLFILHQANARIVEGVARRLKLDSGLFPMNLMEYGNTSSASIPILLDELNRNGTLQKGMKLVMAGFGAGLSWGATYLEW